MSCMTDFYYFKKIKSTNEYIKRNIHYFKEDVIVMAEVQIMGKGRLGRLWESPAGGCWFSYLRSVEGMSYQSMIPFLVGLSSAEALEKISNLDVRIKWPNDLIVDNKKIGGILCETLKDKVIIGIGINTNFDSELLSREFMHQATTAADLGRYIDNFKLTRTCVRLIDHYIIRCNDNVFDVLEKVRNKMETIGRKVRIYTPTTEIFGDVIDIDIDGALIISYKGKREKVYSGDCIHVR